MCQLLVKGFVMRVLVLLLLLSTCLMAKEAKFKDESKKPHPKQKQKQTHRQWLKHPLYIPPGEHFIDESIQPGKRNPKKQPQKIDHKTTKGPNPFYQYKTGQTGFKTQYYDPKTGQVGFAQIPGYYRRKTGKTGSKTGQSGFVPIPMYMTKIGKTGFKKFPLYKTKTGQAGFLPIPMYLGKTGFKNFPSYKTKTGQAGFLPIPMYLGKTGFKKFPSYKTKTGRTGFLPVPMYLGKTGFKNFPWYKTKTGRTGFLPVPMYMAKTGKTGFKKFPLYDTKTRQTGFMRFPMYGVKRGKENNPLYRQSGLSQMALYQMMAGQPVEVPSVPGMVPGLVPILDTATQPAQPMYFDSPSSPVQEIDTPLLAANQLNMMYPTGLTSETGLTGYDNGLMNQGFALPGLPVLPLAPPAFQASETLAQSVLGQANAQAKSVISGPKKQADPSFTVSVNGVVRSVVKQGGSAVNLDAGGASITLSKKDKVLKQNNKKRQKGKMTPL